MPGAAIGLMSVNSTALPLSALLSQVLIAYTEQFDREMDLARKAIDAREPAPSLALWANVLRFVGEDGVNQRQLAALSGVSKPVVKSMVACLERHGWIAVDPDASDKRATIVHLSRRGAALRKTWESIVARTEEEWEKRFGKDASDALRRSLETIVQQLDTELPHYPMAMAHRGGTPTGE